MPFGWVAAASLAGSVYSANKADSANKRGMRAAERQGERDQAMQTEMLAYYRERDAMSAGLQRQANAIAGRVANAEVALMNQQRQHSDAYFKRAKDVFWPVENGLVAEAQAYDTPARREAAAATAIADVESAASAQRGISQRNLTRMGINPNSGAFASAMRGIDLGQASAKASAGNTARTEIEDKGWAKRYDVTALGKGLPSNATAAAGTAVSAGNAAVNAAYAPVQAFNQSTQITGNGMMSAATLGSNAGRMLIDAYNNQANQWGQVASGFGNLAGSAMGAYMAKRGVAA